MHPLDYYFNPYKIYNLYKIKKMVLDNSKKLILLNIDDIKKNKECLIHKIALEQVSDKLTFDEALFTRRSLDLPARDGLGKRGAHRKLRTRTTKR